MARVRRDERRVRESVAVAVAGVSVAKVAIEASRPEPARELLEVVTRSGHMVRVGAHFDEAAFEEFVGSQFTELVMPTFRPATQERYRRLLFQEGIVAAFGKKRLDEPPRRWHDRSAMCRNIRVLHNFEPPTTPDEVRAAALQYVRKVSGLPRPSESDRVLFEQIVAEVASATERLVAGLTARTPPRTREGEIRKARARWKVREARMRGGAGGGGAPQT